MAKKKIDAAAVITTAADIVRDTPKEQTVGASELAAALVQAINLTKPVEKKTFATRKSKTPWTPTDGSPKAKLKRVAHQHGVELDPDKLSSDEINLFNKLRPGRFLDGHVTVTRRRDRGIDIS